MKPRPPVLRGTSAGGGVGAGARGAVGMSESCRVAGRVCVEEDAPGRIVSAGGRANNASGARMLHDVNEKGACIAASP